jgi:DnaJ-domain-containing protein 1
MSIPDRVYKISKAYLGQVKDRIDGALTEREDALRELEGGSAGKTDSLDRTDEIMRRAEEKVAAARREMEASRELRPVSAAAPTVMPTATSAPVSTEEEGYYKVLGVPAGSDYATVRGAYEKLIKRLDVTRFENETDKAEAERILARVNAAYEALRSKLDPTQNRFGKLEL